MEFTSFVKNTHGSNVETGELGKHPHGDVHKAVKWAHLFFNERKVC